MAAALSTDVVHAEEAESPTIPFRMLGSTGLAVSVLGFGFWASLGSKSDELDREKTVKKAKSILHAARSAGM